MSHLDDLIAQHKEAPLGYSQVTRLLCQAAAYRQALVDYRTFTKEAGFDSLAAELTDRLNAADEGMIL